MTRSLILLAAACALTAVPHAGLAQQADFQAMAAAHAKSNDVPEALVHRVIMRESKYNAGLVGRGGTIGLMQIKLATARGVGYSGTAEGLRDPDTNLTYGIKYLAGAFRAAHGDHNRAVRYYAGGYYYAAKRLRTEVSAPPHQPIFARQAERLQRLEAARTQRATATASAEPPKPGL